MLRSPFNMAVIITALSFSATSAAAQAFGIDKATPLSELDVSKDLGTGSYVVAAPSPHSEFETYVVQATDQTGVCLVRGIGKDHDNDMFGVSVRDKFSSLRSALEDRYGDYERVEFLRSGALWDGQDEWVMSIRQNERAHQAIWAQEYGSDLPTALNQIILNIAATSSDSSWIGLQYTFDNHDECERVLAKQDEEGL